MKYDIYGVGNALVDIQAQVSDEILSSTGYDKGIMTLVDDSAQASTLSRLNGRPLHRCAGGSAANTVVAVADFGGTAAYAGKVSRDELGDFFLLDMRRLGVTVDVPQASGGPTGTCAVLITPDAQRTMLTNLGVCVTLSENDIDENAIRRSRFVYIEGYLLTNPVTHAAAMKAIELAKTHQVRVALTASDPFLCEVCRDEIWRLVEGPVDLFFCNEQEARSLTGRQDPVECAAELHRHSPHVAMTLGANGSILMNNGEVTAIEGVPTSAIDTTGAGDMYAGALIFGITSGMTLRQAGHLASHAAARIVSQLGARMNRRFTAEEMLQFSAM